MGLGRGQRVSPPNRAKSIHHLYNGGSNLALTQPRDHHARPLVSLPDHGLQCADVRPCCRLRGAGSAEMSGLYFICGVIALALFIYLLVALFNAENL